MHVARTVHVWVCWAFVVLLPVQFLLAGMGVTGGDLEAHMAFGGFVLHMVIQVLLLLTAAVGRMGWAQAGLAVLLFALLTLQIAMIGIGSDADMPIVSGLHVALAALSWPFVYFVMLARARRQVRSVAPEASAVEPTTA